jgi:hypothetical protein
MEVELISRGGAVIAKWAPGHVRAEFKYRSRCVEIFLFLPQTLKNPKMLQIVPESVLTKPLSLSLAAILGNKLAGDFCTEAHTR